MARSLGNYWEHVPPRENDALTPREVEVLRLAVNGTPTKQIATLLGVGLSTAKKHREAIHRKLKSNDPISMVRAAIVREYITVDEWLDSAMMK